VVEGFPNTFLQAWFSRIPVVSLTFSCDDILEQFGIGKVSGSLDKLEEDISYLLQNQIIRNEMGNKGFLYIQENHFPDCILKKYQDAMSLWENAEEKCSKGNNQ